MNSESISYLVVFVRLKFMRMKSCKTFLILKANVHSFGYLIDISKLNQEENPLTLNVEMSPFSRKLPIFSCIRLVIDF